MGKYCEVVVEGACRDLKSEWVLCILFNFWSKAQIIISEIFCMRAAIFEACNDTSDQTRQSQIII